MYPAAGPGLPGAAVDIVKALGNRHADFTPIFKAGAARRRIKCAVFCLCGPPPGRFAASGAHRRPRVKKKQPLLFNCGDYKGICREAALPEQPAANCLQDLVYRPSGRLSRALWPRISCLRPAAVPGLPRPFSPDFSRKKNARNASFETSRGRKRFPHQLRQIILGEPPIYSQKMILPPYAEEHFWNPRFFADSGWSGGNFGHPARKRLVSDTEAENAALVPAKDMRRSGGDHLQAGFYSAFLPCGYSRPAKNPAFPLFSNRA